MMKSIRISRNTGILVLACALFFTGGMFARAEAWRGSQAYEALKPEMQAKYDAIMKSFHEKMTPLMEKMMAKRLELNALTGNPNMDQKHVAELAGEIAALRMQMRQERFNLDERLFKEVGLNINAGYGPCTSPGWCGGSDVSNRGGCVGSNSGPCS